jgi:hypothetical protein
MGDPRRASPDMTKRPAGGRNLVPRQGCPVKRPCRLGTSVRIDPQRDEEPDDGAVARDRPGARISQRRGIDPVIRQPSWPWPGATRLDHRHGGPDPGPMSPPEQESRYRGWPRVPRPVLTAAGGAANATEMCLRHERPASRGRCAAPPKATPGHTRPRRSAGTRGPRSQARRADVPGPGDGRLQAIGRAGHRLGPPGPGPSPPGPPRGAAGRLSATAQAYERGVSMSNGPVWMCQMAQPGLAERDPVRLGPCWTLADARWVHVQEHQDAVQLRSAGDRR